MTQLLIVVGFMTFFTVKLINLMNKVFGADFCDEKYQFKRSLVVFVFTYLLHCTLYALVLALMDTYRIVWSKRPYIIECVFILVQIIYDFFPLILLFRQHHNHFTPTETPNGSQTDMGSQTNRESVTSINHRYDIEIKIQGIGFSGERVTTNDLLIEDRD